MCRSNHYAKTLANGDEINEVLYWGEEGFGVSEKHNLQTTLEIKRIAAERVIENVFWPSDIIPHNYMQYDDKMVNVIWNKARRAVSRDKLYYGKDYENNLIRCRSFNQKGRFGWRVVRVNDVLIPLHWIAAEAQSQKGEDNNAS